MLLAALDWAIESLLHKYNQTRCVFQMGFLSGRYILITGKASIRSIAYGIAKATLHKEDLLAPLTITNKNDEKLTSKKAKEFSYCKFLKPTVSSQANINRQNGISHGFSIRQACSNRRYSK